ncbi:MAG TPA: hypothetical protein VLS48_06760 [Anaerolineales bacterium]|nr:hypothetical protein [Anaerolineales bacterium]
MNRSWLIPAAIVVLIIACLCCLALLFVTGVFTFLASDNSAGYEAPGTVFNNPTATPRIIRPTERALATETGSGSETDGPFAGGEVGLVTTETLATLEQAIVPINDLPDLSERLGGVSDIPETVEPPAAFYQAGDKRAFWVTDTDTNETAQVQATLRYVTDHLYFWIEDGVNFDERDVQDLAETFENKIYPTNREFFGSEWTPGVDGDPHLYILYARGLGSTIAGYFSAVDAYHPLVHEFSNAVEMFLLSADNVSLDEEFAYSVLAHEFQHMIHWYRDRNEESWMNEGFSELAAFLNGYDVGGTDYIYTLDPDIQLTYWPAGTGVSGPYYGSAFLFMNYFLNRFGEEATKQLVAAEPNGMVSVDEVLAEIDATDPETGAPVSADDLFADWVITTYLDDPGIEDGRYTYSNYPNAPQTGDTETVGSCPLDAQTRDVSQYGVDYIRIDCRGDYTLEFVGSMQVGVAPVDPYSGDYMFWTNSGDESDMTLTRSFDFSEHTGDLTLTFQTWYDIEEDYDYVYLVASTDGGENWQILDTPSGTDEDPSGNSYGWAYNGQSGGWIEETVDISALAGQEALLRFEYVTDAAVNGEGLLLDDIAISEIGYFSDFESDAGGWEADGFVRIQNVLPQTFRISVISFGDEVTVDKYAVSGANTLNIPLSLGGEVDEVVVVVSGTTRFTRQKAAYSYSLNP